MNEDLTIDVLCLFLFFTASHAPITSTPSSFWISWLRIWRSSCQANPNFKTTGCSWRHSLRDRHTDTQPSTNAKPQMLLVSSAVWLWPKTEELWIIQYHYNHKREQCTLSWIFLNDRSYLHYTFRNTLDICICIYEGNVAYRKYM